MTTPLSDLAARYRFNDGVLNDLVDGFGLSDWRHRPEQGGNSAVWILGHLARYRRRLGRAAGLEIPEEPWEAEFAAGRPCRDAAAYPPPADLLRVFHAEGARLGERLASMDAAAAARPWGGTLPDGGDTVADAARFLHFHEAMHLGQIGYIRRMRGLPGRR